MIELDGTYGEGGGSLIRVALALSTLTGEEFKVTNIRAGREQPGLKAQHLQAINALKQICSAKTSEIQLGSKELHFIPGKVKAGTYDIDIGTAGSISLLLQALTLPCLFASNKITLNVTGGTCGKGQASVDYLQNVFLPHLEKFVEKIQLKVWKRGYYPKGGGKVTLEISPRFHLKDFSSCQALVEELSKKVQKINLVEFGKLEQIRGIINISAELQDKEVGERILQAAQNSLRDLSLPEINVPVNIRVDYAPTPSIGGEIVLWALFSLQNYFSPDNPLILGCDVLLDKRKTSEQIGQEAASLLKEEIAVGFPVDKHLADQLIPIMALLPNSTISTVEITAHTQTNIYVVEKFLPVGFVIGAKNQITCLLLPSLETEN